MDAGSTWQLMALVGLILLSALFSMSETALTSLSKIRIRTMLDEGVKGADKVARLTQNPNRLLSAILVGNNLVNISASSLATVLAQKYFGNNAVAISTGLMTLIVLIFGEITPKSLAAQKAEKISLKVAGFLLFCIKIFTPVVFVLTILTNTLIRFFGGNAAKEVPLITESELKTMVDVGHEEGVIEKEEQFMIKNVFAFGDTETKDVMVNRPDMVAIESTASYDEIYNTFKKEGYSRIPVYEGSIDKIIGILNFRDFILSVTDKKDFNVTSLLRDAYFTYETKPTAELFSVMRSKRIPVAIVLDEYSGTSGLVALEDLIEEIVGEIDDEYDEYKKYIDCISENEYIIDGSVRIENVNEEIGTRLASEDFDSIGGYVIGLMGHIPKAGEKVQSEDGVHFEVQSMDRNRIETLRIRT